jgi:DNA modification methylase
LVDVDVVSFQPNTIYCGDNKDVLRHFPENSVDMIYLDPPFFSNKQYEVIWNDGYELRSFEDRWKGGINNYIAWMEERLRECHRVLKETGTIYLHCDFHANAHLRILMDRIFGENHFEGEIIWHYQLGGATKKRWARTHDTLFFYSKGNTFTFNWKDAKAERTEKALARAQNPKGARIGLNNKYKVPPDVLIIQQMNPMARERLGYPTQKPEALLDVLVKVSSNPKELVLDPFCGCGTAIAVAHKLGRRWIGIDVSPTACKLMAKRMRSIGARDFKVIGLPMTISEVKSLQPFEFQNWVFEKLYARVNPKKVGDLGIDGWLIDGSPVQVKQSENVGRNVVDNFETAMQRIGKDTGLIVALSFGRGAYEEVARAKNEGGLNITLKTVEEILKET